jgi:hypothetical protein
MDGVTLFVAALTGGGLATGVTLVAARMRRSRTRVRRRDSAARTARGGRPRAASGRPVLPARTSEPRTRVPAGQGGHRPVPPPTEALGGETLQLGPVPAWKVPVASPARVAPAQRRPGRLFGRRRGSEYASAAATSIAEAETGPDLNPTENRNDRDFRTQSVVTNASRRHDPRTSATGRSSGR